MDFERELALHHNATIRAIDTGRVDLAKQRLTAYVRFAEAFLDVAAKEEVHYSVQTARNVTMMDWPTPTQIGQYVWDGVTAAIQSGNRELITSAAHLLISFLEMSIAKQNYLFYPKTLRMFPYVLSRAYNSELISTRELIIDSAWRNLQIFSAYFLVGQTSHFEPETRNQLLSLVLWTFSDLLKVAMDESDVETFGLLGRELNLLFDGLDVYGLQSDDLNEVTKLVSTERNLVWFGLGAWVTRSQVLSDSSQAPGQPDQKLVDPSRTAEFLPIIGKTFTSLRDLAKTHDEARYRGDPDLPWERWLWQTLTEREVHSVDFGQWLTWFYAVQGLRLSKADHPTASDIPIPHRELQYRINDLDNIVEQLRENPAKWSSFFPFVEATQISDQGMTLERAAEYFLEANRLAVREWQHARDNQIILAPLDSSRLSEFIDACIEGWQNTSWVVTVFQQLGLVEERRANLDTVYKALHYPTRKDAYIEKQDAIYHGFGRREGAQLGRDVSRELLEKIESASTRQRPVDRNSAVDQVVAHLANWKSAIVVMSGEFELQRTFLMDPRFVPSWKDSNSYPESDSYLGRMGDVPVYYLYDGEDDRILVASLEGLGTLIHYIPQQNNHSGLLIRVEPVDLAKATRLATDEHGEPNADDVDSKVREETIRGRLLQAEVFIGAKIDFEFAVSPDAYLIPVVQGSAGQPGESIQ